MRILRTVMIGAIHWNVIRLKRLALYSADTSLVFGTGGFAPHFSGFALLYHCFFFVRVLRVLETSSL